MDAPAPTTPGRRAAAPVPTVAAVLVAHDGAPWLPQTLTSLGRLQRTPDVWHAVDVSSTDGSAELLRDTFGAERVSYAPAGTGFGDAVRVGLAALPDTDWIWLLHDDLAPAPDALAALLDEAQRSGAAILGPKLREWPSLRRLLEVGLSISGAAIRETGLEPGEPDAGQHDRATDVLAVNTAGMLIRRDVWDELGGLDPIFPLYADDLDLGWRANRAGHRVRVAPQALAFHAEAGRRSVRRVSAGDWPHWERRRAEMLVMAAHSDARRLPWRMLRLLVGTLLRSIGHLIAGDPESAGDELLALRSVAFGVGRLRAARRDRVGGASERELRALFPPWWLPYQHAWDGLRETVVALVRPETMETSGRRSAIGASTDDDDDDLDDGPSFLRRRPWLAVVMVLTVASFAAARGLDPASLSGGALTPAPDTAAGWWRLVLDPNLALGLPASGWAPTPVLLLAFAAIPVWFGAGWLTGLLLILAVPLAGLTAHRLARLVSDRRSTRIVVAVSWGLIVVGSGAVAQGRLGAVVALIVAPIVVNLALQLVKAPGWQRGVRLGIWVAVAIAFSPVVVILAVAGLLVLLSVAVDRRRDLLVAAGVAVVLLGPWLAQRALRPDRIWWDIGQPVTGSGEWPSIVLGSGGGAGVAPWWFALPIVLLAMAALVPTETRRAVQGAWLAALVCLAVVALGAVSTISTPMGLTDVRAWVGVPSALALGALLLAMLLAAEELQFLPRLLVAGLAALALVWPIGTGAWWLVRGIDAPLTDRTYAEVPPFLAPREGSTLVIRGDTATGVSYRVVPDLGPRLGEESMLRPSDTSRALDAAVQRLLSAPSATDVQVLIDAGIDAVYAPSVDPDIEGRIDAIPSLEPSGGDRPGSRVWTIDPEVPIAGGPTTWWRTLAGSLQALAWVVAVVVTAPVRRRAEPPPLDDDEPRLTEGARL